MRCSIHLDVLEDSRNLVFIAGHVDLDLTNGMEYVKVVLMTFPFRLNNRITLTIVQVALQVLKGLGLLMLLDHSLDPFKPFLLVPIVVNVLVDRSKRTMAIMLALNVLPGIFQIEFKGLQVLLKPALAD
jgi:hypothetical protein